MRVPSSNSTLNSRTFKNLLRLFQHTQRSSHGKTNFTNVLRTIKEL